VRYATRADERSLIERKKDSLALVQATIYNHEIVWCSRGRSGLLRLVNAFEDATQITHTAPVILLIGSTAMPLKSSRAMTTLRLYCVAVLCLALTACAGGYYTSKVNGEKKVYRVDEQGAKTLVYETDPTGQTTIHDTQDPMAKRQVAAQEMAEQIRANKAAQLEALSAAPKRQAEDPIYVSLAPPVLDGKMQQAEKPKGAVAQQIRNEFATDPIIKLVAGNQNRADLWKPHATPSIADVEVSSKVSIKEVYGVNRRTGKPGKMVAVVFEATITSQVPPASYTVSESGHVLQNVEVSKRFARQVRQVIVEKIGPDIPAN
jgi:hypothetical protein